MPDYYEIILKPYIPVPFVCLDNVVIIRYPDRFQLLFDCPNTMLDVLGFNLANYSTIHPVQPYHF